MEVIDDLPRLLGRLDKSDLPATSQWKSSSSDHSSDSMLVVLGLSSVSPTPSDSVDVVLLYDLCTSFNDWCRYLKSLSRLDLFFAREALADNARGSSSCPPFVFSSNDDDVFCASVVLPFAAHASRSVKAAWHSGRAVAFEHLGLERGQSLRLPVTCNATSGISECAVL